MPSSEPTFIINYSVEAGCLGAQGTQKIEGFCLFLTQKMAQNFPDFCTWDITPQVDIHQRHIRYTLNNKKLSIEQATRYLDAHNLTIKIFEDKMDDFAIDLIEEYLGR